LISAVIRTTVDNGYGLVIGKVFSAYDLGIYNRARSLMRMVVINVTQTIQKTTFPMFSKINDDYFLLRKALEKSINLIYFFLSPILVLLIVLAKPLVLFLLTDKWIEVVPYFQLLCISGFLQSFGVVNMHFLLAIGKSDLTLKLVIVRYSLQILILITTFRFGIVYIIYGQILCSFFDTIINTYYSGRFILFGFLKQINSTMSSLIISVIVGIVIYMLSYVVVFDIKMFHFVFFFSLGILLYAAVNFILKNKNMLALYSLFKLYRRNI
jgi:O-antigen/teichoic acid export membrane protein